MEGHRNRERIEWTRWKACVSVTQSPLPGKSLALKFLPTEVVESISWRYLHMELGLHGSI